MTTKLLPLAVLATAALAVSGCYYEDFTPLNVGPGGGNFTPSATFYETCYTNPDCNSDAFCEEFSVAVSRTEEQVIGICTVECYDDLDCPDSSWNGLPAACVPSYTVGGVDDLPICVERCRDDDDCDFNNGFYCNYVDGDAVCMFAGI